MTEEYFRIAKIMAADLAGELTEKERQELINWRESSEENKLLYGQIIEEENRKRKQRDFLFFSADSGWEAFGKKRRQWRMRVLSRYGSYAALVLLFLGVGYYFAVRQQILPEKVDKLVDLPGSSKAYLTLADGEIIDLGKYKGEILLGKDHDKVRNQGDLLSYTDSVPGRVPVSSLTYNQVDVPRCGEYQVKLSDGTVVFLNSLSSLRFPVCFAEDAREVELSGEAYFVVAKEADRPFIVHTGYQKITVLGTEFNVSVFKDDPRMKTTLVRGRVQVSGELTEAGVVLAPGEQLVFDKTNGKIEVRRVEVKDYTAWKDGQFRFRDLRLEEIMQVLKRWYKVEVEYVDCETRDYIFGLNCSRNETIQPLLEIFEQNGKIRIQVEGNKLKIRKGR